MQTNPNPSRTEFDPCHILVAIEPFGPARAMVAFGRSLADEHDVAVNLISVTRPPSAIAALNNAATRSWREHLRSTAHLRRYRQTLARDSVDVAVTAPVSDAVDATICERAEDDETDLVVVGQTERSWLARTLFGSTSQRVVRKAPCSVLVIPPDAPSEPPEHVIVGTDLSTTSDYAILAAATVASRVGAKLTVVHAHSAPPPYLTSGGLMTMQSMEQIERTLPALLDAQVRRVLATANVHDVEVEQEVIHCADLVATLVDLGDRARTLLAVGSHCRTGFERWVFGSIAEAVTLRATCPVLVARGGDHDDEDDGSAVAADDTRPPRNATMWHDATPHTEPSRTRLTALVGAGAVALLAGALSPAHAAAATLPAAEMAAAGPQTTTRIARCVRYWAKARYRMPGYDHVVGVDSGCQKSVRCEVSTNIDPKPIVVDLAPHEAKEVITRVGSPARDFTPHVACRFIE